MGNTLTNPLMDGGGNVMIRAARSGDNDDGDSRTDLVVRCSNANRNIFNEPNCKISYQADVCVSAPFPDPDSNYVSYISFHFFHS